jgi:hypothetical protein
VRYRVLTAARTAPEMLFGRADEVIHSGLRHGHGGPRGLRHGLSTSFDCCAASSFLAASPEGVNCRLTQCSERQQQRELRFPYNLRRDRLP